MGKARTTPPASNETPPTSDPNANPPAGDGAGASPNDAPPANAEDKRVANQRQRALEDSLQLTAERASQAEARANALEGEVKKERKLREAAEGLVTQLKADLARANTAAANAGDVIEGLPKNAFQVRDSVTIAALSRGGSTARRAHPKKGDVLLVGSDEEVDALQQEVGSRATVHRVDKDTIADLKKSGFLSE